MRAKKPIAKLKAGERFLGKRKVESKKRNPKK